MDFQKALKMIPSLSDLNYKGNRSLSGGCINDAAEIRTNEGSIFVKWNSKKALLESELEGLKILQNSSSIKIPEVYGLVDLDGYSLLFLEFIESGRRQTNFWENFGTKLAEMHLSSSRQFGFESDNFIGSLPQKNSWYDSWIHFFIEMRLRPQIKMAGELLPGNMLDSFEILFEKLPSLLPEQSPQLLHGDLWSGNYMVGAMGDPVIIDPSVYYGVGEVDLAMTQLFGGFESVFYQSYLESNPLEPGWESRLEIYKLYPLLVHVNLFGSGYMASVQSILKQFTG